MNIVLTGFMGTGKSAVGKSLAKKLGWVYYDTDAMIEQDVKMPIPEIFARNGEAAFRTAESRIIQMVSLFDKSIISCGGGVVLRTENMDELEKNGVIVCLTAQPETILARTKNSGRPLLAVPDPLARIRELLESRKKHYTRCHLTIDTSTLTPTEVADKILDDPLVKAKM